MKLEEAQIQLNVAKLGDEEPKNIFLSDAARDKIGNVHLGDDYFSYNRGALTSFAGGLINTIQDLSNYGSRLKVFGGQGLMAVGDMVGSEKTTEIGKEMIQVAQHNIDKVNQNLQYASPEELESFASNLGGGAVNYGLMFLAGGVSGAGAKALGMSASSASKVAGASVFSTMFGLSAGMEAQERVDVYKQRTGDKDLTGYTPSMAGKNFVASAIYGIGEGALEKWAFKEQKILFKNPLTAIKTGAISGLKEGGTETTQSLLNIGIDLADGTLYWKDLPEAVKGVIMEAAVGGTLGFTAGMGVGYANRSNAIKELSKQLSGTIKNPEEATAIAKEVVDNSINTLQGVIATELKLSTELKDKYGETFNSMQVAVKSAMDDSGAFKDMTEDEVAQYATETARRFADEVVAEANKRNVLMQDVVNSNDIIYKDGKLYLAPTKAKQRVLASKKKKPTSLLTFLIQHGGIKDTNGELSALDAQKGRPGLVNNKYGIDLDRAREFAEEAGYFGAFAKNNLGSTTVDDLLTLIDKELRGERVFTEEAQAQQAIDTMEDTSEAEYYYERILEENGVNYEGLTFEEKKEAYEMIEQKEEGSGLEINDDGILLDEFGNELFQEQLDLKEEMDAIDMHNDAYEGETININGVERTVYNSNGDRIAKSESALRAFYKWFGDSKVVDEQGRPLVVYHGSPEKNIKVFDKSKIGRRDYGYFGQGFSFTPQEWIAEDYSKTYDENPSFSDENLKGSVYPVYLKIENPKYTTSINEGTLETDELKENGYDGVIVYSFNEYSESVRENDQYVKEEIEEAKKFTNEWWQLKNYDDEVIGKKFIDEIVAFEPNQIKSVYNRGTFSLDEDNMYLQSAFHGTPHAELEGGHFSLEKMGSGEGAQVHGYGLYYTASYDTADIRYRHRLIEKEASQIGIIVRDFILGDKNYFIKDGKFYESKFHGMDIEKSKELTKEEYRDKYQEAVRLDEEARERDSRKGQVYEVDIPESPYLLDEQKTYNEQSDFVKSRLRDAMGDDAFDGYFEDVGGKEEFVNQEITDFEVGLSGGNIYDRISNLLGSDKDASQLLEKYGIKGITYFGETDGRCFVIFNPDDVKVIQKFYQVKGLPKGKAIKRGSFDASEKVIQLFEDANTSTLPHELAHFWLDNMWTYANSGVASEIYKAQFEGVKNFLGVKPNQTYLTRQQHEKFASAYEKYVWRGEFPTPIMGAVFGNYERWLRRVYDSIADIQISGKGKVRLTPEIIKFFDSMTTGELPSYDAQIEAVAQAEKRVEYIEKNEKDAQTVVSETQKTINENRAHPIVPIKTDTKTSYLTAYEKTMGEQVEAGVANLEKENEKAVSFVQEDIERAKRIVDGSELPPQNIMTNFIYDAYAEQQRKLGNRNEEAKARLKQALELRRYGQEIVSQRMVYSSTFRKLSDATHWIGEVMQNRTETVAQKANLTVEQLENKIRERINYGLENGQTPEQIAQAISEDTGLTLYQETEGIDKTFDSKISAYSYVYQYVNKRLGKSLTEKEAFEITSRADDMLMSLENSIGDYGNPSIDYFKKLSDMEMYANSLSPSPAFRVYADMIGPTNLMASVKTPLFNIEANIPVALLRMFGRRVKFGQARSIVDVGTIKDYLMRSWEVFRETGYNLSTMTKEAPEKTILGEKVIHLNERNRLARIYAGFLKWGIGTGDLVFKDFAFVDSVSLQATKLANGDVKKANELFLDAVRVEPKTKEGSEIRSVAMTDALVSTYQNDSELSKGSLKVREGINKMTFGLGKTIIPFAKTPANVMGFSARMTYGPLVELGKGIIKGKIDWREFGSSFAESSLAYTLAALLVFLGTDDDDYMPPYVLASSGDRNLARELNIPFNSIRIDDTWYSLDIVGPLGSIASGMLQARREEGIIGTVAGFVTGSTWQLASVPGLGGASSVVEYGNELIGKVRSKKSEEASFELMQGFLDVVYSRTVPAIVSDVAKVLDQYEREAEGFERIAKKIPILRNTLEERVSKTTGKAEKRGGDISRVLIDLFVGARIKQQIINPIADELLRLNNVGQSVSLSSITRSGDLKNLPDELKPQVLREFAEEYAEKVGEKIKADSYRRKSDEEKKKTINGIRERIVSKIKRKYRNKLKTEK